MKKIIVAIFIVMAVASIALAETVPGVPAYGAAPNELGKADIANAEPNAAVSDQNKKEALPDLLNEQNKINTLPEPYETICQTLSNGKETILKDLSVAVIAKINEPEARILANLGVAVNRQYASNQLAGMTKFCAMLDNWDTLGGEIRAAAAFIKGYQSCGVVVIPAECIDGEPVTKLQKVRGKNAWFIPFKTGTDFTVRILGKSGATAKVWKILRGRPVSKEWQGGPWEREILIKAQ